MLFRTNGRINNQLICITGWWSTGKPSRPTELTLSSQSHSWDFLVPENELNIPRKFKSYVLVHNRTQSFHACAVWKQLTKRHEIERAKHDAKALLAIPNS